MSFFQNRVPGVGREDLPTDGMFPNFIATETHMPALPMNLLAHLTSYVCSEQMPYFEQMFVQREGNHVT